MPTTKLQRLQVRLGAAATGKAELLEELIESATQSAANYCHRLAMPPDADTLIVKMAVIDFNRLGTEGGQSQSFSGVSESWIDGYPIDIRAELNRYRKARFV